MNQNDLVEVFCKIKSREFSMTDFIEEYRKHFGSSNCANTEEALVGLYLQKLVQNNVLAYERGRYHRVR